MAALSITKNPKRRFWIAVGSVPLALLALALVAPALNPSGGLLRLLFVGYWVLALWFVLSAHARLDPRPADASFFSLGLWLTIALALSLAATGAVVFLLLVTGLV